MTKNTLFISVDGLSDPLGQSQIIPYLKIISKKNENLYIYSMEKKKNFFKNHTKVKQFLSESNIHWKFSYYLIGMGKFGNILNYLNLFLSCLKIVILYKINIIHGRGHIPSLFGYFIKFLLNIKLIFDFRGFWIDERVDNKSLNLSNYIDYIIYKFNKYLEIKILNSSSKVVCLTNKAKNEILKITNIKKNNIIVVPCCTDFDLFNFKNKRQSNKLIRKKLKIPFNSIVFSYCGSLGGVYLIDEMLDLFFEYQKKNKDSYFLIITNNLNIIKTKIDKIQNNLITEKIIFLNLDRENIPIYLSVTNIFLSFIKNSYARIAMSPTKISECLSLGIPVIINNKIGDTEEIINICKSGFVFDINDKQYSKKILNEIPNIINLDEKFINTKSNELLDINIAKIRYNTLYDGL